MRFMENLKGYIEHIVYRNDENGYTVLNLVSGTDEITCVGFFRYADEGENVELRGEFVEHAVYGEQFSVSGYEILEPTDEMSIIRYLGSGAVKGVGMALAKRIVSKFGEDTFRIIEDEPERLSEIKGISEKKAREIATQIIDKQGMRKIMVFLQQFGISNALAMKIFKQYGNETYHIIKTNPYILAEDINGVGFKIADEIATKAGIHTDCDFRIRSGIIYVLSLAVSEGHCFLTREELISHAIALLDVPDEGVSIQIDNLAIERKIIIKHQSDMIAVYSSKFYYMELNVARMLSELNVIACNDDELVRCNLKRIEQRSEIELEELQKEAVVNAVRNGITIITGGPGTGKTTIINMIIKYFAMEKMNVSLAAPTGRAAKRMSETTGCEASTIQRLLHLNAGGDLESGGFYYEMNEDNPLDSDVVIIDEMSMVDLPLFNALLKAISVGTRLILVGDTNQLPSVGPGSVLKDLIRSECFNVVKLQKIFRQAEQSDIVVNAHRIQQGVSVKMDNKSNDFFFLKRDNADTILGNIVLLVKDKLPKYVNATSNEIQVLTPMRKGILGVVNLNRILQRYLNPPDGKKKEKEFGDVIFRVGDKVMQIKNNYQLEWEITSKYGIAIDKGLGVFNGDTGVITDINEHCDSVTVEYDGMRKVNYSTAMLEEIELAYAVTIHKSQGSEYPAVVIPILSGPKMLFNRNLLYTGVTRARNCVVLLGDDTMIEYMIGNENELKRYSGLNLRIKEFKDL